MRLPQSGAWKRLSIVARPMSLGDGRRVTTKVFGYRGPFAFAVHKLAFQWTGCEGTYFDAEDRWVDAVLGVLRQEYFSASDFDCIVISLCGKAGHNHEVGEDGMSISGREILEDVRGCLGHNRAHVQVTVEG